MRADPSRPISSNMSPSSFRFRTVYALSERMIRRLIASSSPLVGDTRSAETIRPPGTAGSARSGSRTAARARHALRFPTSIRLCSRYETIGRTENGCRVASRSISSSRTLVTATSTTCTVVRRSSQRDQSRSATCSGPIDGSLAEGLHGAGRDRDDVRLLELVHEGLPALEPGDPDELLDRDVAAGDHRALDIGDPAPGPEPEEVPHVQDVDLEAEVAGEGLAALDAVARDREQVRVILAVEPVLDPGELAGGKDLARAGPGLGIERPVLQPLHHAVEVRGVDQRLEPVPVEIAGRDQPLGDLRPGKAVLLAPEDRHHVHDVPAVQVGGRQVVERAGRHPEHLPVLAGQVRGQGPLELVEVRGGRVAVVDLAPVPLVLTDGPDHLRQAHLEQTGVVLGRIEAGLPYLEPGADVLVGARGHEGLDHASGRITFSTHSDKRSAGNDGNS